MAQLSAALKAKGVDWPDNLWAGTSVTGRATTGRIEPLLRVGGEDTIRFLSVEPQREEIDLTKWLPGLDWVIQGGESGRSARPFHIEWALDLIGQCKAAGVAYFLKQLGSVVSSAGERLRFEDGHAGDWSKWPEGIRVRQMPSRARAGVLRPSPSPFAGESVTPADARVPLVVLGDSKGRRAALRAWETRRAQQGAVSPLFKDE